MKIRIFEIFFSFFLALSNSYAQDTIFQKFTDYTLTIVKEKVPEQLTKGYYLYNYEGLPVGKYNLVVNSEKRDSIILTGNVKINDVEFDIKNTKESPLLDKVFISGNEKSLIFYGAEEGCDYCPGYSFEIYSAKTGRIIQGIKPMSGQFGFEKISTRHGNIYYTASKGLAEMNLVKINEYGAEVWKTRFGQGYLKDVNGHPDIDYINFISVSESEKHVALAGKLLRIFNTKGELIDTVKAYIPKAAKFIGDDYLFTSSETHWQLFDVKNSFKEINSGKVDVGKIYDNSNVLVFPKNNLVMLFTMNHSKPNNWLLQIIDIATGKYTIENITLDFEGELRFRKTADVSDTKSRHYSDKFSLLFEVK